MKNKYPIRAKNETGDVTVDVQEFVVPDSAITAGSGSVTLTTASGDVVGPASATNEAATVFDGTTGKTVKDGSAVNVLQKRAVESFTTTATAAGTTTLTVASNPIQEFTGVTTQTVVLPVVTTLPKTGFGFTIINNSTGALTVNSSGANAVQVIAADSRALFTCVLLTGTTAASWAVTYTPAIAAVVAQTITNGVTTSAPSQDAVFDALALKANAADVPTLASGVYTPTLVNAANLDGSTAYECQYMRVGNTVTVSGQVDMDATAAATNTQLYMTLPIASTLAALADLGGTAAGLGTASLSAAIYAETSAGRAVVQYVSIPTANASWFFSFTYQII